MTVIEFSSAIVARRSDGGVLIALMDGEPSRCVGLLLCSEEAARAFGIALKAGLRDE